MLKSCSLAKPQVASRVISTVRRSTTVTVRASTSSQVPVSLTEAGPKPSLEYRIFFNMSGKKISPWHDLPLFAGNGLLHFVCEIPKESKAKMEVATDEPHTPIKQDVKKGKLRDYPYNINWNYGLLPQTWEDPKQKNTEVNASGDNDPVDVVEIGTRTCAMGGVYTVKPLGVYAMIDDGELDWKVIAIRSDDPMASKLNDVADVEKHMPGELEKIRTWFQDYKIPDGKPANKFGYNDKCLDRDFTMHIVNETHGYYNLLKNGFRANSEELSLH